MIVANLPDPDSVEGVAALKEQEGAWNMARDSVYMGWRLQPNKNMRGVEIKTLTVYKRGAAITRSENPGAPHDAYAGGYNSATR